MKTLKALAALLEYPTEELIAALGPIDALLHEEGQLGPADLEALAPLLATLAAGDLLELQENYVATFDCGRATSLNLFEHVHGESRDRGQAMVDLRALYEREGLVLSPRQLPDYLPAMLEYLSYRPVEEARAMLVECAHILRSIAGALARRGSPYAAVPQALLHLAGEAGATVVAAADAGAEAAAERAALDAAWAEEPVTFLGGCATRAAASVVRFTRKGASS